MKPLVIYHASCADGFGAAFAAWLKLGDEAEYVPMAYGEPLPELALRGREVYVLDFSFEEKIMLYILSECGKLIWLDHHLSSQPLLEILQNAEDKPFSAEMDSTGVQQTGHKV